MVFKISLILLRNATGDKISFIFPINLRKDFQSEVLVENNKDLFFSNTLELKTCYIC